MDNNSEGQTIQAVENASNIIDYLAEHGAVGAAELGESMDIPQSTAFIYLKSLYECGYLTKTNGEYRLALRFLERGARVRREYDIYNIGKEEIDKLGETTGEVANLGVEEEGLRVLMYSSEGSDAVYDDSITGNHTHMHLVSLGKAILSAMTEDRVTEIINRYGLPQATQHTITDREELWTEIERINEQGYAVEDEEHWEDIRAVAVPICLDSTVHGAISVSGPKTRFDEERIGELSDRLYETKNIIELRLEHYQ